MNNFNNRLYENLSLYDKLILFGADKEYFQKINLDFMYIKKFAIMEFQNYLEKNSLPHVNLLHKFTKCLLSKECHDLEKITKFNQIGSIFQKAYDKFINDLIIGEHDFKYVAYKNITQDNNTFINIEYKNLNLL